jgi:hypothetical protein
LYLFGLCLKFRQGFTPLHATRNTGARADCSFATTHVPGFLLNYPGTPMLGAVSTAHLCSWPDDGLQHLSPDLPYTYNDASFRSYSRPKFLVLRFSLLFYILLGQWLFSFVPHLSTSFVSLLWKTSAAGVMRQHGLN